MPPQVGISVDELSKFIDSAAESALEARRIAGLSVAVATGDEVVHARGYGYANLERQIPASADTVYGIGSVTKQVTAVAVMQLVERGLIRLDDPFVKHLPGCGPLQVPATVQQLLNHTAGIRGEADLCMLVEPGSKGSLSRDSMRALVSDELFDCPPGRTWRYSNFGYYLLGILVENVSGDEYGNYIQRMIIEPAGLAATSYGARDVPPEKLAKGYTDCGGRFANVEAPSVEQTFSSGALCSTVQDLLLWQTALRHARVIRRETYQRMTSPDFLDTGEPLKYGYGFFLTVCGGHREVSHDGTTGGFSSQLAYYPDDQLAVAVLTNSESHEAERIEKRITRYVLGVPEPPTRNRTISSVDLAAYAGTYLYKGLQIPVFVDSETLIVRSPGRRVVRLLYQGDHTFIQEDDLSVCFEFAVYSERADGFIVSREGKTLATVRRLM